MNNAAGACIFCGRHSLREAFPVTDMFGHTRNLCVCTACKTWCYDPQPGREELAQAYNESYYGKSHAKFRWNLVENVVDYYRKKRARSISRYTGGKGAVLDIGCGNGRLLHFLKALGDYEIHGTEMPGNSADRARQIPEINLFIGPFNEAHYLPQRFDAVSLFHVFEHLPDPAQALEKASRLIKPGGILILSFPNIRSLQARLLKAHWLHLDPPRHLFFPDPVELTNYIQQRGFRLIRKNYFSPEQNPVGAVQGLLNMMSRKRDLLFERMKGNDHYLPETGKFKLLLHKIFFILAMPFFIVGDVFESLIGKGATITLIFRKIPDHGHN